MFRKTEETRTSSAKGDGGLDSRAGAAKGRSSSPSVIGPTLVFKGELSADEDLVIEGKIEGTIAHQKKNVTVGKQGRVKADIHARSVTIEGTVHGDVRGDEFVLLAQGANVSGNIFSPRIKMEDGARFNGSIEMGKSQPELAVAQQPQQAKGTGT